MTASRKLDERTKEMLKVALSQTDIETAVNIAFMAGQRDAVVAAMGAKE